MGRFKLVGEIVVFIPKKVTIYNYSIPTPNDGLETDDGVQYGYLQDSGFEKKINKWKINKSL